MGDTKSFCLRSPVLESKASALDHPAAEARELSI